MMKQRKICMSTLSASAAVPIPEQLPAYREVGLDGFFTRWDTHVLEYREIADRLGLIYQSVHAPNDQTEKMWDTYQAAKPAIQGWLRCIDDCAAAQVPIMVAHAYRGIGTHREITRERIDNFRRVMDYAGEKGVSVALENTEGSEYLTALLDAFETYSHVGFCWDTGHELCYYRGQDMTENRGHRMICTHLNDNLGCRTGNDTISADDDLHLLPFDGVADWKAIMGRLDRWNYRGILTFELKKTEYYREMSFRQYLEEAYSRVCRVAALSTCLDESSDFRYNEEN